jgi:hypothetical protein
MSLSTIDLAEARDTVNAMLKKLQLDAYLFEVEPRDENWELTIECACDIDGGWKTIKIQVPKEMLLRSFDDDKARSRLFADWRKKLAGCKLQQP